MGEHKLIRLCWALCLAVVLGMGSGCQGDLELADAYGNFESTETVISAETAGILTSFSVREGQLLRAGVAVGLIDTTQLALRRRQLAARSNAVRARFPGISGQVRVLEEQRRVASRELERVEALVAEGAGTGKQLDDVLGQIAVLDSQIQALRAQNAPVFAELDVVATELDILNDQIRRSVITNPIPGRVLTTYAEAHEMTAPGRPLYRVAPLDTLQFRGFVSGAQLPAVALGQAVTVHADSPEGGLRPYPGIVSWISSQAEFTPKLIQTRETRVDLVYAFRVRVPNPDGSLKLGMPGQVTLGPAPGAD